jgi:hypothetical protein
MSESVLTVLNVPRQTFEQGAKEMELDPLTVFFEDFGDARGQMTVVCWGRAWTHYWGNFGSGTVRDFVLRASTGYMVGKLMLTRDVLLKRAEPREEKWLTQIVEAIKKELRKP